ncbi:hypothetical protein TEHN7118_2013 [Tetragenococcus halophilus subsp. halophilus]|uniref:Glycosyltransferase 2-like domain-containing protein n=1 Tax=Tetragenococcus halophilus subsp. halophilus TaxID=1513897 RepID=A0A2H6CW48_TETHA|nr:glycosyltransferase family 2 protein [Tetragenococcus halophilus]GBD69207.1 hypothetical protein TEHN7118_2013 [Tetragenococcus halophilus subsp. halophilus]
MTELIVVTPTYNRKELIERLYKNLLNQSSYNFKWLIIDDGSTDGTEAYVQEIIESNQIVIEYHYKTNGGKGKALNYAFELVENDTFLLIVDSDDTLLYDGVNKVKKSVEEFAKENIGAIFFLYEFTDGKKILGSKKELNTTIVSNRYEYNNLYGQHDGCIGYYSHVVKKYKYPEFDNETYIGPTVIQLAMSQEFNIVFTPQVIGVAEYQPNGLTKKGRKLRINNPKGMVYYAELQMSSKNKFLVRLKYAISVWAYLQLGELSVAKPIQLFPNKKLALLSYLPGMVLSKRWKQIKNS